MCWSSNTNQCRDVQDWFSWYARELDVPLVGVYTHRDIGAIGSVQIQDIGSQIEDMVPELEAVTGEKLDMDRFKEVLAYSKRTSELWRACLELASAIPSPWTFFDATIHMGPAVVARGTPGGGGLLRASAAGTGATDQGRGGRRRRRKTPDLLGRYAHLGKIKTPVGSICIPQNLRGGIHLLQQLDI